MKRIVLMITLALVCTLGYGQTAKQVLDKAAQVVSNKQGVTAKFSLSSTNIRTVSGTIS